MAGLLDFSEAGPMMDPMQQGLLAAAFNGLQASGPSRMPVSLGQIIGSSGQIGLATAQNTAAQQARLALAKEQIDAMKEQRAQQAQLFAQQVEERKRRAGIEQDIAKTVSDLGPNPSQDVIYSAILPHVMKLDSTKGVELLGKLQDRKMALEQRLAEMEQRTQDKALDRESRDRAARDANDMKLLIAQMGNATARAVAGMKQDKGETFVDAQGNTLRIGADGVARPVTLEGGQPVIGVPKGANQDKLTEQEGKASVFYSQMNRAQEQIKSVTDSGFNPTDIKRQVDLKLAFSDAGNMLASREAQEYAAGAEQWAESYLRFKTGAATNRDEIRRNARNYFPMPGDKPETVALKNKMRLEAAADMGLAAGKGKAKSDALRASEGAPMKPWEKDR